MVNWRLLLVKSSDSKSSHALLTVTVILSPGSGLVRSKHLSDRDDLTSTTAVYRVTLSPNLKETNCVLCVENVSNPNYRRGLFKGSSLKRA